MESSIILKRCRSGLGMKIGGGQASDGAFTGIFVKRILIGGAVSNDGTLQEGDELLSANGENLRYCTNDQAVSILRNASQSGTVKIAFRREPDSRERLEKLFPSSDEALYSKLRQLSLDVSNGGLSRSDSMSSRVSTTSLEKRAWVYTGKNMSPAPLIEAHSNGHVHSPIQMGTLDLPLSPREQDIQTRDRDHSSGRSLNTTKLKRAANELDRASSFDSGLPSSGHYSSPDFAEKGISDITPVIKIEIPARSNLGISIVGGKNKQEGPHVYVKEVIEGCDAYSDGRIRKGDRIISINGESFTDVTYEQARSILLRLKLQTNLTHYSVHYVVNPDHLGSPRFRQLAVTPENQEISPDKAQSSTLLSPRSAKAAQDSSPYNAESLVSQSSDEEAVVKELMKMMEKSDEDGIRLNGDTFSKARADISERHPESISYVETYEPLRSDLRYLEEASPESNSTVFKPGKFSSPAVENGLFEAQQKGTGSAERKTISQYLEEDMNDTYPSQLVSPVASRRANRRSRGRRLSLDPMTKLRVEKLEGALNYLGFEATPSKINEIRRKIGVNSSGFVTYGDFVEAAREVYDVRLDDRSKTLSASALQFAMRDIEAERKVIRLVPEEQQPQRQLIHDIAEEEYLTREQQQQQPQPPPERSVSKSASPRLTLQDIAAIERDELTMIAQREAGRLGDMQAANRRIQDDLARVSRERDDILRELQHLKRQLNEKNSNTSDIGDQLERSRQEVTNAQREVGEMRVRTHLVSSALQGAKQREQQFEQKIKDLTSELDELKSKSENGGGPKQREFNELQKRLVVLGCQLRKTEVSKRTYEVAVEKLTKFAERVHDSIESQKTPTEGRRNSTGKGKSPSHEYLSQEARDTVRAVKLLLEEEPLPFGWEEVYSSDGTRYYINHVTQTTSWLHPVSGVQHTGSAENGIEPPPTDKKF